MVAGNLYEAGKTCWKICRRCPAGQPDTESRDQHEQRLQRLRVLLLVISREVNEAFAGSQGKYLALRKT